MSDGTSIKPDARAALWRNITKIDRGKVNKLPIALRNSVAVAVPLAVGIALGNPLAGVAVATGALNVAYSDGTDPYAHRARRMLAWSFIGAIAVFTGSITSSNHVLSTLVTMAWAFVAGMQLAISPRAGDLGLNTLVALIVFSARGPTDLLGMVYAALLVLGGGLLQTAMALLFWALDQYEPERRAVASVYDELARGIATPSGSLLSAPLSQPPQDVQDTLNALGRDFTFEGERFRYLFDQVDRIRLSAFALQRLCDQRREQRIGGCEGLRKQIPALLSAASQLLLAVSHELLARKGDAAVREWNNQVQRLTDLIHQEAETADLQAQEISAAVDVFVGQIQAVARLAGRATPESLEARRVQKATGPREEFSRWLGTLRANVSFDSSTFRHAIRLAVWVGVADTVSRAVNWQRSYWIPMTVAVILKPDFTTTLSRGFLRLLGTLAGLALATVLYHQIPGSALTELVLVGVFTFVLRMFGPANYGIFSLAISGLIVFLIAETGVPPAEVVALRGTNTLAGGLMALLAYVVWPTWERNRINETFAELIDTTRAYFHALVNQMVEGAANGSESLEEARQNYRRARSNAEGSVDKVSSEPNFSAERLQYLTSMLASSQAMAESMREMEVETMQAHVPELSPALQSFCRDAEFTLYYLSAALRGSAAAAETLPKLREDHRRLVQAKNTLGEAEEPVLLGTDRITTTLNTLREQVVQYLSVNSDASNSQPLQSQVPDRRSNQ